MEKAYDVIVIGAGAVGCAAARFLSRFDLKIAVLEKGNDVALGASKANSGIVHAGFDAEPGTLKARMNVRGNELIQELSQQLGFRYKRTGAYVLCFSEDGREGLAVLKARGEKNQVRELRILDGAEILDREPNVSKNVVAGLFAETSGIVCPYGMTIALAENAAENGAEFLFLQEVIELCQTEQGYFSLKTSSGKKYSAKVVVNAAGINADYIHNAVCRQKIQIVPRRGEYCLFDRTSGALTSATLFRLPDSMGKGVLVTPTADGNLLIGPNAQDIGDKTDTSTSRAGLSEILDKAAKTTGRLNTREIITQFAGLRAHLTDGSDFLIGETETDGFFDAAGIESPGLTAAPAIGEFLAGLIAKKLNARENKNFIGRKNAPGCFREADSAERERLIRENPLYGNVVCRCETVTEAEIVASLHGKIPAADLDGVKRRTRAQMGRCQGGFCTPKILEIIAREKGISLLEVQKANGETVLKSPNKTGLKLPGGKTRP